MREPSLSSGNEIDKRLDNETLKEFGGSIGVAAIMIGSHAVVYYLWIAWSHYGGSLVYPASFSDVFPFFGRMWDHIATDAAPTWWAVKVYVGFLVMQALLAAFLPGLHIKGLPIPSQNNERLDYNCNGITAWYVTLVVVGVLHFSGVLPLGLISDNFGPLMTVAIISGNVVAIVIYVGAFVSNNTHRMSGSHPYDFFMGAWLNPRIGRLDIKMWAEIRVAWIMLFLLTLSAAAKQYEMHGAVSTPMWFMVLAHFLYANACMKGEECIPTTWDIFYEKWGWMLIYWNLAGVPFVYCFNAQYIAVQDPFEHSTLYTLMCFVMLVGAYYVWDTAQSQRNRFRMQMRGTFVKRLAFPQLPWGTLEDPEYMQTAQGNKLLVDGWWRYARKIHYTADILMALSWGLICGFDNFLPYFYVTFFVIMITHRAVRDMERCKRKYGEDWDQYCKKVPHTFVPFLF